MSVFVNTDVAAYVDSFGFHAFADKVELGATFDDNPYRTYASNGWQQHKVGLGSHMMSIEGFHDYAATGPEPAYPITGLGGFNVFTVAPQNLAASVADPCFIGQGTLNDYAPMPSWEVGSLAKFRFGWIGDSRLCRAQILHPEAARTSSGNGTTTTFTTPVDGQQLIASFHVLSVSGTGSIVFKIQTDDNSGMTTAVDQITSSSFTAVGAERATVNGPLTGETHIRTTWTITGFTSVTFVVATGVA